jgi:hypothetical protein
MPFHSHFFLGRRETQWHRHSSRVRRWCGLSQRWRGGPRALLVRLVPSISFVRASLRPSRSGSFIWQCGATTPQWSIFNRWSHVFPPVARPRFGGWRLHAGLDPTGSRPDPVAGGLDLFSCGARRQVDTSGYLFMTR